MSSNEELGGGIEPYFKGHGYIEKVDKNTISGWACDLNHLNVSIILEVKSSSGKAILSLADIYRKDVHDAKFGNGRHGFKIDIEKLDIKDDTINIHYLDDGSLLNETPIDFDPDRALLNATLNLRFSQNIILLAAKTRQKYGLMLEDGMFAQ